MKLTNGKVRRCHQDQIRNRSVDVSQDLPSESDHNMSDIVIPTTQAAVPTVNTEPSNSNVELMPDSTPGNPSIDTSHKEKTYPNRKRAPVKRFEPTWT